MHILPWAQQIRDDLNAVNIKSSTISYSRSDYGQSAYFAVRGLGEVRFSDHPRSVKNRTSAVEVTCPANYLNALLQVSVAYNEANRTDLSVHPTAPHLRVGLQQPDLVKPTHVEDAELRQAFWEAQALKHGLRPGSYAKDYLKKKGVRYAP